MFLCVICDSACRLVELNPSKKKSIRIAVCSECGHAFHPSPPPEWIDSTIYNKKYHSNRDEEKHREFRQARHERHAQYLSRLQAQGKQIRILDVGCGSGEFLEIARKAGIECYGVEISDYARKCATSRGFQIIGASIDDVSDKFDVIRSCHVLEHIPSPRLFVKKAKKLISREGIFLTEVPNERISLFSRLRRYLFYRTNVISSAPHIHYFSPKSLKLLFFKEGIRTLEIATYSDRRTYSKANFNTRLRSDMVNILLRFGDMSCMGRNIICAAYIGRDKKILSSI